MRLRLTIISLYWLLHQMRGKNMKLSDSLDFYYSNTIKQDESLEIYHGNVLLFSPFRSICFVETTRSEISR